MTPRHCKVLILGAGPAGLAAAARLQTLGISDVVVLEREQEPGGIPRHTGHGGYGLSEFKRWLNGPDYAQRLLRQVATPLLTRTTAVALKPGGQVETLNSERGPEIWQADAVLLALGARETPRSARLVGGTRPWGVMTTGALQQFVYLKKERPFQRPVIIGSELVAFSVLVTLKHGGMKAAAMLEEAPRITARRPGDLVARWLFGTPVLLKTKLEAILGQEQVEAVAIQQNGSRRVLPCDGVIFTGQFRPETAILVPSHLALDRGTGGPAIDQYWRCDDPSYFAAGNLLRPIETAGRCWAEGRAAADMIAAQLDGRLPLPTQRQSLSLAPPLRYAYPQVLSTPAPLPVSSLLYYGRRDERRRKLSPPDPLKGYHL